MAPRRVIIRTLDVGGDKKLPGCELPAEANPFLGLRGIRLSLKHQDVFHSQLRALLRAARYGNLAIMLPMITDLSEVQRAREILAEIKEKLSAEMTRAESPPLGVMVETPAAALLVEDLAEEADFFSVGTNDLIQYVLAVDRLNEQVAYLYQPFHPAVLRLLRSVAEGAQRKGKWVGACGEMGGNLLATPLFVGLGFSELSMNPSSIPSVKNLIRHLNHAETATLTEELLKLNSATQVVSRLKQFLSERFDKHVLENCADS
jgi:phosphotransferase system enzyme I (PtsI)